MAERLDTVIIGAGQAGLAASYYLSQQGREHVVLEKDRVGEAWRSKRWDSFTLVTPNWAMQLPGFAYQGNDPDGFFMREEVVRYLDDYVAQFYPPLRLGVEATSIQAAGDELVDGFVIESSGGAFVAVNVILATGAFQKPKIPAFSSQISPHIHQIHSGEYRNSHEMPLGAILVVGSGQSGCQIADELYQGGRKVYLSTGGAGRLPRRYRGKDIFWWLNEIGMMDRTVDKLPSPDRRFDANPQMSGKGGGRWLNLHQFALDGVTLLGRLKDGRGTHLFFAEDLVENLAKSDKPVGEIKKAVDDFIAKRGIEAPDGETLPDLRAGYDSPLLTELDLNAAAITSIIWAAGYAFDFSWVKFPIFDQFGYPVHQRGVTAQPGLYFVGLQWLHKAKSSLLLGVGEDAEYIAAHIAEMIALT